MTRVAAALALGVAIAYPLAALGSLPPRLWARTPSGIAKLLSQGAHAGDCDRCHTMHAGEGVAEPHNLVGPDDNTLCATCHPVGWAGGSYGGPSLYLGSDHGGSPAMIWPGPWPPPRLEAGAGGKCLNCHDPHGWADAQGEIPALRVAREEGLCLNSHDGRTAETDVRIEQLKPYRHPTQDFGGRHSGPLEALPTDFGITPINRRHAECEDCHNPHVARAEAPGLANPDAVPKRLLGVSRLNVVNGPAGSPPTFTFIPGSDTLTTPGGEWQLCFKCHSSWTTQPTGQTDLAAVLNPNNRSYHPVEAAGPDPTIAAGAFETGWDARSRTICGDCHGSDHPEARGPHGSLNAHLLRRPYDPGAGSRATTSNELCFTCHQYSVYADAGAPEALRSQSRFNAPASSPGHAGHVAALVPCGACHVTHGSSTLPHLIRTGAMPGLVSYTETPTGGTCATTCHADRGYTINYAR